MSHLFALALILGLVGHTLAAPTAVVCQDEGAFGPIGTTVSTTTDIVTCPGGGTSTALTGSPNFVLPAPIYVTPGTPEVRSFIFTVPANDPATDVTAVYAGFFTQQQTVGAVPGGNIALYTPTGIVDTNPVISPLGTAPFRLYNPSGTADAYTAGANVQQLIPNTYGFQQIVGRTGPTDTAPEFYTLESTATSEIGVTIQCTADTGLTGPYTKFFTIGFDQTADTIYANLAITCIPNFLTITILSCPTSAAGTSQVVAADILDICDDSSIDCDVTGVTQAAPTPACPTGLQTITVVVPTLAAGNTLVNAIRAGNVAFVGSASTITGVFGDSTIAAFTNGAPSTAPPATLPVRTTIRFCGSCASTQASATIAAQINGLCQSQAIAGTGTCGIVSQTCVATDNCEATINQTVNFFGNSNTQLQTIVVDSSNVATANALAAAIRGGFIGGIPTNAIILSAGGAAFGTPIPVTVAVPNPLFGPFNPATNPSQPLVLAVTECLAECGPSNCPDTITSSQEDVAVLCGCQSCGTVPSSPLSPLAPSLLNNDLFDDKKRAARQLKGQSTRIVVNAFGVIVALSAGVIPCIGSLACCEIALEDARRAGVPFGSGATCFCPGVGIIDCPDDSSSSKKGLLGLLGLLGLIPLILCCCLLLLCCMRRKRAAPDVPFAVFDPHQGTMLPQPVGGPVCGPSVIPSAFGQSPVGPGGILM